MPDSTSRSTLRGLFHLSHGRTGACVHARWQGRNTRLEWSRRQDLWLDARRGDSRNMGELIFLSVHQSADFAGMRRYHKTGETAFTGATSLRQAGILLWVIKSSMAALVISRPAVPIDVGAPARLWIARIMVNWGLISIATLFVRGAAGAYTLRFLLRIAQAGFFPGVIYYLGLWYRSTHRTKAIAGFAAAVPVTGFVGGPLSGAIMALDGAHGLAGWQWIFLPEGRPAVLLGVLVSSLLILSIGLSRRAGSRSESATGWPRRWRMSSRPLLPFLAQVFWQPS